MTMLVAAVSLDRRSRPARMWEQGSELPILVGLTVLGAATAFLLFAGQLRPDVASARRDRLSWRERRHSTGRDPRWQVDYAF